MLHGPDEYVVPHRSVLEYLAGGKLISWGWVGWELVIKVALYAGVLAALTTFFFNRREIALPTQ